MTLRDRIAAVIAAPAPPAVLYEDQPATGEPGHPGNLPYEQTPGQSFDTGTLTDWAQEPGAGGWPDDSIERIPPTDAALYKAPAEQPKTEPLRKWVAETVTFAAGDRRPRLVTPSGIDARQIIAVHLNGHVDGFTVGPASNDALVGFLVPLNRPIRLEAGPVWAVAPAAGGQLAVAVEYWSEHE